MMNKLTSLPFIERNRDEVLIHRYGGIPFIRVYPVEALDAMKTFEVRSDDLFLITYPKAGP